MWLLIHCPSFVIRASSSVPALAPIKALKLRTSLVTGRRSKRVPRAAASVATAGELSRATTAAARPQQEEAAAAAAQALVPRDPHEERGRTHSESQSTRGREAIRPQLVVIPPPGGAVRGGRLAGQPPGPRPRCWWCG
jgi:hypothetical protein